MKPVEQTFSVALDDYKDRHVHNIEMAGSDIGVNLMSFNVFEGKSLEKWGVFYQEKDSLCAKNFVAMMERVLTKLNYNAKPMAMFPV